VGAAALIAAAKAEQNRAREARLGGAKAPASGAAKDPQGKARGAPTSERSGSSGATKESVAKANVAKESAAKESAAKESVAKVSVAKASVGAAAQAPAGTPAPAPVAESAAKPSGPRAPKSDTESTVANPVGAAALIAAAKAEQNRAREARLGGAAKAPAAAAHGPAKSSVTEAAKPSPTPAPPAVSQSDHPANAESTVFRPAAVAAALSAARTEAKPTRQNIAAQSHVLRGSRPSSDSTVIRPGTVPASSRRPTPAANIAVPSEADNADPSTGSGVSRVRSGTSGEPRVAAAATPPQAKRPLTPQPPRALPREELPAALSWSDEDPIAGGALDGAEDRLELLEASPVAPVADDGPQLEVSEVDAPDLDAEAAAFLGEASESVEVLDEDAPQLEVVDEDAPQLEVLDDPAPTSEEVSIDEAPYDGDEDEDEPRSQRVVMYECFLSSDYENALALAESVLAADAQDPMANAIIEECRAAIRYRASIPVIASSIKDWTKLELDSRSAFVLSRVDGVTSVEMLLDMCGALQPAEVLHVIDELYKAHIIDLVPG
jgi:hypothetical protein